LALLREEADVTALLDCILGRESCLLLLSKSWRAEVSESRQTYRRKWATRGKKDSTPVITMAALFLIIWLVTLFVVLVLPLIVSKDRRRAWYVWLGVYPYGASQDGAGG
jgi:hypothetical protein